MIAPRNCKVTIAIPTFNRSSLVRLAIDSALRQTHRNIEVIVSDNCSTDNTVEVLSGYSDKRMSSVTQPNNLGMVGNWNACLARATGDFFLLLSDDDILEDHAIDKLLSGFADAYVTLAYGPVLYVHERGAYPGGESMHAPRLESGREFISGVLRCKRAAFPSATLYRTIAARNAGGYPEVGTATDLALHLILAANGNVAFSVLPIARYRIHDKNESFSERAVVSQLNLIEWVEREAPSLSFCREQLHKYSASLVFAWGRSQALRGNKNGSFLALSVLQRISPKARWKVFFALFSLPSVRFLASILRSLRAFLEKHRLKTL